jgi:hypothetical protein
MKPPRAKAQGWGGGEKRKTERMKKEEKGKKKSRQDGRCNCYLPKHILIPIS